MEYILNIPIPELKESDFVPGATLEPYRKYLDNLFVNVRIGREELGGTCTRNTRLLLVNIERYVNEGRQMIADAFPHCAVLHGAKMIPANMHKQDVSEEDFRLLTLLSLYFYLVIPIVPSHVNKYVSMAAGGNYSRSNNVSWAATPGSMRIENTSGRGVVDVFCGGKAMICNETTRGNSINKRYYLEKVISGTHLKRLGMYYDVNSVRDVTNPITEAHFDAVLETL